MKKINYGFVYLFTVSEKGYVGQTPYLKSRFKNHFGEKRINPYFHNSLRKHFSENRSFKIIECWKRNGRTLEEFKKLLGSREIFWTEKLGTFDPEQKKGWNLTKGGAGTLGWKASNETKQKMSEKRKGENHPFWKIKRPEISKMNSERVGEKHWNFGQTLSEVTKQKMRKPHFSQRGVPLSLEHKRKLSEAKKGKPKPKGFAEKISQRFKGIPKSEEHKRKLSEAKRNKV